MATSAAALMQATATVVPPVIRAMVTDWSDTWISMSMRPPLKVRTHSTTLRRVPPHQCKHISSPQYGRVRWLPRPPGRRTPPPIRADGPCSPRVRSAMRPPRAARDKAATDGEPSRRPGLCCPAMENAWPDNIEPLRAGLTDEEFADLLDQERWTEDEAAMLRAAGMRVVTPEEARAGFIPPTSCAQAAAMWSGTRPPAATWSPPPGRTTATRPWTRSWRLGC